MASVEIDGHALAALIRGEEMQRYMGRVGREVRDRARANAKSVVPPTSGTGTPTDAIIAVTGTDDEGAYVDVGYSKHHPGFYLWWWEVGTVNHPARPHLRPAASPHG